MCLIVVAFIAFMPHVSSRVQWGLCGVCVSVGIAWFALGQVRGQSLHPGPMCSIRNILDSIV